MDRSGVLRLANAIIIQAVRDAQNGRMSFNDFDRFVHSEYFQLLSRGALSPDALMREVYPFYYDHIDRNGTW